MVDVAGFGPSLIGAKGNIRRVGASIVGEEASHALFGVRRKLRRSHRRMGGAALTGRDAAGEANVDEIGGRRRCQAREGAFAGKPCFERQLRTETRRDVLLRRQRARLVVDDAQRSVGETIDAVGAGG